MTRLYRYWSLLTLLALPAWGQEELLWKVDNTASPTLVPAYQNLAVPFNVKQVPVAGANAADDEQKRRLAAEAAASAELAEKNRRQQALAEAKAQKLLASPDAVVANLSNIHAEGVLQGPMGNSMLLQGRWFPQGTQLRVSTTLGVSMTERLTKLGEEDAQAGQMAAETLRQRLIKQDEVSITLVEVTSASAIFSDGRQRYVLTVSQSAF